MITLDRFLKPKPITIPAPAYLKYGLGYVMLEERGIVPCKNCGFTPCDCGKYQPYTYEEFIELGLKQEGSSHA